MPNRSWHSCPVTGPEILIALVIAVGLIGIVVPVLPGDWLILAAVVVWAADTGGVAWAWAGASAGLLVIGGVVKYAVPGRRLKAAGIATSTMLLAGLLGIIGFFVVPVVGLPLGFVLGIYVMSWQRQGRDAAWPATIQALKAVGQAIAIELGFALLAAGVWAYAVLVAT